MPGRIPGAQVRLVDEPWEPEAEKSSIRYPSDLFLRKPSTDVVVVGSAVAPGSPVLPQRRPAEPSVSPSRQSADPGVRTLTMSDVNHSPARLGDNQLQPCIEEHLR